VADVAGGSVGGSITCDHACRHHLFALISISFSIPLLCALCTWTAFAGRTGFAVAARGPTRFTNAFPHHRRVTNGFGLGRNTTALCGHSPAARHCRCPPSSGADGGTAIAAAARRCTSAACLTRPSFYRCQLHDAYRAFWRQHQRALRRLAVAVALSDGVPSPSTATTAGSGVPATFSTMPALYCLPLAAHRITWLPVGCLSTVLPCYPFACSLSHACAFCLPVFFSFAYCFCLFYVPFCMLAPILLAPSLLCLSFATCVGLASPLHIATTLLSIPAVLTSMLILRAFGGGQAVCPACTTTGFADDLARGDDCARKRRAYGQNRCNTTMLRGNYRRVFACRRYASVRSTCAKTATASPSPATFYCAATLPSDTLPAVYYSLVTGGVRACGCSLLAFPGCTAFQPFPLRYA